MLEEIDAKKHSNSERLRDRARELLLWIKEVVGRRYRAVTLCQGATIELLLADRRRYRPDDADEELLDVCHDVIRFTGRGTLVTADTAMRLRALTEGLEVFFLPAGWDRDARNSETVAP